MAAIRFYDWMLKKTTHINTRFLIGLLLAGLTVAQFIAYKNLRQVAWSRIAQLDTENRKLIAQVGGLQGSILEKDKRIEDLRDRQVVLGKPPEQPRWIGDVRFFQSNEKHEHGFGTWLHVYPDVTIRPPRLRIEFDVDVAIKQWMSGSASSSNPEATKLKAAFYDVSFSAPPVFAGDSINLIIFGSEPFKVKRIYRFGLPITPQGAPEAGLGNRRSR